MRIAAIQHDIVWEDPDANFERLAPRIASAAAAGARMAILTEMFSTGFSMNTGKTAEPVDGPSARFLAEQAGEHDLWAGASLPEQPDAMDRPYNTFVLAGPGGELHRYRKIHPFTYSGEHEHFAAGEEFTTVDVEGLRVSLFVCYDLRFADEFWAVAPDTDLYLVPANWPEPRRRHWSALLRARAIENQAYVVGVNRVGEGDGLRYVGDSAIIDPMGEVLASGAGTEALLITDVHAERVQAAREELPFMPDRR
ncbi:MAG: nitrilase-related carbon-nitrogen hydrolase [Nitriliruptorales bacterium]|nr:nitrilase-related carbon-nitrogen hydrolase [Nitriliruptorales bacterium]